MCDVFRRSSESTGTRDEGITYHYDISTDRNFAFVAHLNMLLYGLQHVHYADVSVRATLHSC